LVPMLPRRAGDRGGTLQHGPGVRVERLTAFLDPDRAERRPRTGPARDLAAAECSDSAVDTSPAELPARNHLYPHQS